MAVMVEKRYGRAALIDCMHDTRLLLVRYNAAAKEMNARSTTTQSSNERSRQPLALWPREVLEKTQAPLE